MAARMFCALLLAWALPARANPVVAVAPFAASGPGVNLLFRSGLPAGLAARLQAREVRVYHTRQVHAAATSNGFDVNRLRPEQVVVVGRMLGADRVIAGEYAVAGARYVVTARVLDADGHSLGDVRVGGLLADFFALERELARGVFERLDLSPPDADSPYGTDALLAVTATLDAEDVLLQQSMSPKARTTLPKVAVEAALERLDLALHADPSYQQARGLRATALALLGDFTGARAELERVDPRADVARFAQYFVQLSGGRRDQALAQLQRMLQDEPRSLLAMGYLAEAYLAMDRPVEAMRLLDEYLGLVPRQPWVLAMRARCKAAVGDQTGAVTDAEHALELVPGAPWLVQELADCYEGAGQPDLAEHLLNEAVHAQPTQPRLLLRLGVLHVVHARWALAVPLLQEALRFAVTDEEWQTRMQAHYQLARALAAAEQHDAAIEHLRLAVRYGFDDVDALNTIPELAPVRDDPRFAAILQYVQGQ